MRLLCAIIVELLVFLEVLEGLILLLLDSARMSSSLFLVLILN